LGLDRRDGPQAQCHQGAAQNEAKMLVFFHVLSG
jgi:hypothetical protein